MSKSEALNQLIPKLIDNICENLIDTIVLKKDIHTNLNVKLSQDDLSEVRNITISKFTDSIKLHSEELLEKIKIDEKLNELKHLELKNKNVDSGWRPIGDPLRDSYGPRHSLLKKHIERLELLKNDYLNKIERKTAC